MQITITLRSCIWKKDCVSFGYPTALFGKRNFVAALVKDFFITHASLKLACSIISELLQLPSPIGCLYLMIWPLFKFLGQKLSNFFVGILVKTMTPKRHFEINWPLENSFNYWSNLQITKFSFYFSVANQFPEFFYSIIAGF